MSESKFARRGAKGGAPFRRTQKALHCNEIVSELLMDYGVPHIFPQELKKELEGLSDHNSQNRVDLRELPLVTIDGESAKDFDDAVHCKEQEDGTWKLWVAIADVSSYVRPDSVLDEEACLRGTSIYFPGKVIPMLPPALSDDLCSLRPHKNRLCLTCEMHIDTKGKVIDYEFYQGLMRSHHRLSYKQVAELLELNGRSASIDIQKQCKDYLPHLHALHRLFLVLAEARHKRGAINFDSVEYALYLDNRSYLKGVKRTERNDAHRLIEECMLAANVCAANFLDKNKIYGPYRVHEELSTDSILQLRDLLSGLGLELAGGNNVEPKHVQALFAQVKDTEQAQPVYNATLRAMNKAVYSPVNKGHFGLCYPAYAHYTSPIRRYPDLLVHRVICDQLQKNAGTSTGSTYSESFMKRLCQQSSDAERRADEVSSKATQQLVCSLLLKHIGERFTGWVSGITDFGLFIKLVDYGVDGLVHVSNLKGYYRFDERNNRLIEDGGSQIFSVGNKVKVNVDSIMVREGKIGLSLV